MRFDLQAGVASAMATEIFAIGLAIVKRFLEAMGGTIKLHSEVGCGTTFTVFLPALDVSARVVSNDSMIIDTVDFDSLKAARIVAADDNATNRELLEEIFRTTHHKLVVVSNGLEACDAVEREHPDIVFLDIRMPGKHLSGLGMPSPT